MTLLIQILFIFILTRRSVVESFGNAFPGQSTRIKAATMDHPTRVAMSLDQDTHDRDPALHSITRQQAFAKTASILLAASTILQQNDPAYAVDSSSAVSPLEDLSLGSGQWKPLTRNTQSSGQINPSFCTYMARFLINYDQGVNLWWSNQISTYSLLPEKQRQNKLSSKFGSLAKSIELAIDSFLEGYASRKEGYTGLMDLFLAEYGGEIDAKRQIGILFSLIPKGEQPVSSLKEISSLSNRGLSEIEPMNPSLLGDDLTALMPKGYRSVQTEVGFTVEPSLSLFEVGIGQENGQVATATAFGPFSEQPLIREQPTYSVDIYALFGISGAAGCALTHSLVIPLDVVKTRQQTNAVGNGGLIETGKNILQQEGVSGLLLGSQATVAGYFWYGLSVYPSYTFFKRFIGLGLLAPDISAAHTNDIALIAGAMASVIASLGLTPIEAARIRAVADPTKYKNLGLLGTLSVIARENGGERALANLYAGLPSLLTRQVIFGSVKFLAFERACESIFGALPFLRDETWTSLLVSLVAGGISGALSSVVSQPADSVLTYIAQGDRRGGGRVGISEGITQMIEEGGLRSLFRGVGGRSVWAASIIAGQFLLYDVFRSFFGVTVADLSQVYEVALPTVN